MLPAALHFFGTAHAAVSSASVLTIVNILVLGIILTGLCMSRHAVVTLQAPNPNTLSRLQTAGPLWQVYERLWKVS